MPNQTAKNSFNTFLENEPVDWEQINANWKKLDGMNLCVESGTKTASYTGGTSSAVTWRYKKYADKTVEMSAKLEFDNLKCNGGSSAPYYSGNSQVFFPFNFTEVYNVQIHLASNTIGWVSNITGKSVLDYIMFKVMGMTSESTNIYKQIMITVKGVIA